jgi:hypothetical protein
MANTTQTNPGAGHGTTQSTSSQHPESSTIPVEMSELDTSQKTGAGAQGGLINDVSIPTSSPLDSSFSAQQTSTSPADMIAGTESKPDQSSNAAISASESSKNPLSTSSTEPTTTSSGSASAPDSGSPAAITRSDSVAIGSSTDDSPTALISEAGPVLIITLLLTSGARHPYKIDEKYLMKRNVNVPEMTESGKKDPFSISVYTLKELILREWREEWEAAPSSPSSIRLIYFGRLLDDKTALKGTYPTRCMERRLLQCGAMANGDAVQTVDSIPRQRMWYI